jgi:hypothetical protein
MLAVPPVRLMPAPAPRLAAPGPAAALPDGAGVPQPTFLGTPCATEHVRRSRAADTRLSRGRPGPRASADVPAPRAPGASGTGPRRNHDDGASPWSEPPRWGIAVVTVPAPGTGTRTRRTTSTTRPSIQALTPEELHPCHRAGRALLDRRCRVVPRVPDVTEGSSVSAKSGAWAGPGPGPGRGRGLGGAGAWAGAWAGGGARVGTDFGCRRPGDDGRRAVVRMWRLGSQWPDG